MKKRVPITCLFLDIGGVLLTDGWDHHARQRTAKHFELDYAQMQLRHRLVFETYERGELSFEEYLSLVVFYEKRTFTREEFREFMCAQSKPFPEMIELAVQLKHQYGLKIVVVSNEGRDVNAFRIRHFKLSAFVDFFVSSCFVHMRKPNAEIFELALDLAQVPAKNIVFIDDTPMFVEVAEKFGIRGIHHEDYSTTRAALASLGLEIGEGGANEVASISK
jgi:putative hydrolase of the HAD superfamily